MEKIISHKGIGTMIHLKEVHEDLIVIGDSEATVKLALSRIGIDADKAGLKFKPAIVSQAL